MHKEESRGRRVRKRKKKSMSMSRRPFLELMFNDCYTHTDGGRKEVGKDERTT